MKIRGKLLAFLAAWLATVGVAFFLPNLRVFAAVGKECQYCMFCAQYEYTQIYGTGPDDIWNEGFFDPATGNPESQAFTCGGCVDNSCWCYLAPACTSDGGYCNTTGTGIQINVKSYDNPTTCSIPAGACWTTIGFTGGIFAQNLGLTPQIQCSGGS